MANASTASSNRIAKKTSWGEMVKRDWKKHYPLYLMLIPVIIYYLVWAYGPMYGVQIAFKDFSPRKGITGSDWVGFEHFIDFFTGPYAWRVIRNTFLINFYNLLVGFPMPIIFAIMINEVRNVLFKRTVQTISYIPYFISLVVMCGMLVEFCAISGIFGEIQVMLGLDPVNLLADERYFRTIYVLSDLWQKLGWDSIIFLSALAGINPELNEAAKIDGASRFKQILHISIPGIMPTIAILLILRIGSMMSLGFEKIILLYNGLTYETADVISSYVYRIGLEEGSFDFAAAVGLFNSLINVTLVVSANKLSAKFAETSLW